MRRTRNYNLVHNNAFLIIQENVQKNFPTKLIRNRLNPVMVGIVVNKNAKLF